MSQKFFDPQMDARGRMWAKKAPRGKKRTIVCRICNQREAEYSVPERSVFVDGVGWVSEYHLCNPCARQNYLKPIHAC